MKLFNTEEEAIAWVGMNIAIAIKPKDKRRTKWVFPFTSAHAQQKVVEHLGYKLFRHQQEMEKQQIVNANCEASEDSDRAEEYYNETFNNGTTNIN